MTEHDCRGLRLSYLRHFINAHGGDTSFIGKTTADVCLEYVVPLTKSLEVSLVDHVANDPSTAAYVAPANWYVSHAWQYLFLETVNSLERFFASRGLRDDAVIWFCVFNNNQHLSATQSFEHWASTFNRNLAAIGHVVMIMHPWNDPVVLRRSWCVFEVYVAVTIGARFEVALARDHEATFLDDIADDGAFFKMLATIKSENSEATMPSDRDGIFALIRAETSFVAVDRLIFTTLSQWIKTALEASIGSAASPSEKAKRWRHLGLIYQRESKYAESERCYRYAVDGFLNENGTNGAETLYAQSLLAHALARQRKPTAEWAPFFVATIDAAVVHLGVLHPTTLQARFYYGASLTLHRDFEESLRVNSELLNLQRAAYGRLDWRAAATMRNLGASYTHLFEFRVAARYLVKAVAIETAYHGLEHHETMLTTSVLANVLMRLGDAVRAKPLLQRCVATYERTLGPDHGNTMLTKMSLALLDLVACDFHAAEVQLQTLAATMSNRPEVAAYRHYLDRILGLTYWAQSKYEVADMYYRRALDALGDKNSAWTFFYFASNVPDTSAVRANALAHIRGYMQSTDDTEPETWPTTCDACCLPLVGTRMACSACPNGLFHFCTTCVDANRRRVIQFCTHETTQTRFKATLPPRRFFFQADLISRDGPYDDVRAHYDAYLAYCAAHKVPRKEQLTLASVRGLARGWHPLL